MTPHQAIVTRHLNAWRNLRAWGRSLDDLDLTVSTREYPKRAGTCWPELQKVNIYHQPGLRGLVGMLKTGLHEFAHAIETKDSHGHRWQERFAKSVSEVTGKYVGWGHDDPKRLDETCYVTMLKWWRQSGNEEHAKRILGL